MGATAVQSHVQAPSNLARNCHSVGPSILVAFGPDCGYKSIAELYPMPVMVGAVVDGRASIGACIGWFASIGGDRYVTAGLGVAAAV